MMPYKPGLHILSEFISDRSELLSSSLPFRNFLTDAITLHGLNKVGEAWHDFEGGGFTAVICLTESHISIHTWPEYRLATFDVFLSNYQQVNDGIARNLHESILGFYEATELQKNEIKR
jgi:S-adenosylmethionine decarboxylase